MGDKQLNFDKALEKVEHTEVEAATSKQLRKLSSIKESKWKSPAKQQDIKIKGKCPYCKRHIENLNSHIKEKHKEKTK